MVVYVHSEEMTVMTQEERRDLARRGPDELFNKGNLDICDELYAPNCSFHNQTFAVDGVAGQKDIVRELRAANPDLHIDVHDICVDGDLTAARWTMGGTSQGEFRGLPATGKTWTMTGMTFAKWEGDRCVEEWTNYDMLGTLQQLGLVPEMARGQGGA